MNTAVLWPVVAMVLLTFSVWARLFVTRVAYMKAERIHPDEVRDRHVLAARLEPVNAPANNLQNLLEMPVLFYLAAILIQLLGLTSTLLLALAWIYVGLRCAHSVIHLGYNKVMHRFCAYVSSCVVLAAIWVLIVVGMLRAG